jgi:hypothetical protein
LRQLSALEFEATDTGTVRIAVPEHRGHDDLAMALCLAIQGDPELAGRPKPRRLRFTGSHRGDRQETFAGEDKMRAYLESGWRWPRSRPAMRARGSTGVAVSGHGLRDTVRGRRPPSGAIMVPGCRANALSEGADTAQL